MQGVEKGRNALIPCKASGEPEPTITWLRDMMPLDMTKPRYSIYQGASLQILSAQSEDEGQYECVAENKVGTAYSDMASLYVKSKCCRDNPTWRLPAPVLTDHASTPFDL